MRNLDEGFRFYMCKNCNYVSSDLSFMKSAGTPCSNCGAIDAPQKFLPLSALLLREMICYFYKRAYERLEEWKVKLVEDIRQRVGRDYDGEILIKVRRKARGLYAKDRDWQKYLKKIKEGLLLDSDDEAKKANEAFLLYSAIPPEEYMAIVTMTCTLLEVLLNDLLALIAGRGDVQPRMSREEVENVWGFRRKKELFKKLTKISLNKAIAECSEGSFYSDWGEIMNRRNKFIHKGSPLLIGLDTAEKSFNLAKNCPFVFAELQNRFAIVK